MSGKTPHIVFLFLFFVINNRAEIFAQTSSNTIQFDFYGDSILLPYTPSNFIDFSERLTDSSVNEFLKKIDARNFDPLVASLALAKKEHNLDDWVFYQLIRKTAQQISPKEANYHRYTLYKWYLLSTAGYDCMLTSYNDTLLFYVKSSENIYNVPIRHRNGEQFVCLNYHDYGSNIDFQKSRFQEIAVMLPKADKSFSYKVARMPGFRPDHYLEKDIRFNYYEQPFYFKIKLNPDIKSLFANYPTVDYESHFNIPLSRQTYTSLIPVLKKIVARKNETEGVDFLMRFTRDAFLFETDSKMYGAEKRLSPEQTLLYEQSDCEDRSALFFYLVKEIYNLPMLVLVFPDHVTTAVALKKSAGKPILFSGKQYTICESTPQKKDLNIGQLPRSLKKKAFEIGYVYHPN